jgi:hypothetical protein
MGLRASTSAETVGRPGAVGRAGGAAVRSVAMLRGAWQQRPGAAGWERLGGGGAAVPPCGEAARVGGSSGPARLGGAARLGGSGWVAARLVAAAGRGAAAARP